MGKTRRKKRRTHIPAEESADPHAPQTPKSFVFKSGKVGESVSRLVKDMRKVMEPQTAIKLKERKHNKVKDFLSVAGQIGVTQFLIFTQTDNGTNLRLARTPRGPTLCFRVLKYSLIGDVLSTQINPKSPKSEFKTSPLVVLNNFGGEENHMKLMTSTLQNMFPSININKMQLAEARRVVMFNYDPETKNIDFRHYCIGVKPVGISKSVRRVVTNNVPDLSNYQDISEYVLREGHVSESEAESGVETTVTLAQDFIGKINKKSDQRAIKLTEIGPRMELKLVKIQAGLCTGEVLFHEFIHKTPEEIKKMNQEREQRRKLKQMRRKEQERNVERKKVEKEAHRLVTSGKKIEIPDKEQETDNEEDEDNIMNKIQYDDDDDDDGEDNSENNSENGSEDSGEDINNNNDEEDDIYKNRIKQKNNEYIMEGDDDDNDDELFKEDLDDFEEEEEGDGKESSSEENETKLQQSSKPSNNRNISGSISSNSSNRNRNINSRKKDNNSLNPDWKNSRLQRKNNFMKGKPKMSIKVGVKKRKRK